MNKVILLRKTFTLVSMLILLSAGFSFHAVASDNHKRIEMGVSHYLQQALSDIDGDTDVSIDVIGVDERIQVPECPQGFDYHADAESLSQPYISVRVSCRQSDWYLFSSAQVTRTRQIVVTAGMLSPGTVLTSENLRLADIDVRRLRHTAYTDIRQLLGARMKRRIRDGSPVQANMLCFVCKGDRITITANMAGMEVKTAGIAQQDGVVGDTIEVVNASSKKSVIAEVASAQTVVVNL
ncbi:flagellar basal body P-ring formation chaperone FlgA [Alteromonas sp. CYL-A6]|uniref:flagellar basal body P-ring formation chaperone FlgA n=1 Tax=Alteromonas nitratireducens TaxID=3390813 RepID=UPI0034B71DCD